MAIKEIVVHQGPDSRSAARLEIAAALAKAHDARIIGVFVKVDPGDLEYSWMAFSKEAIATWLAALEGISGEAEETFKTRMAEAGLESEWRVMEGNVTDAVMTCARYGDLTLIGQTNPDEPAYDSSMPDQVVMGAGGPVLVVPYVGHFESVGKRMMVAWSGEREAARAVRDAIPILKQAESVVVYSINPGDETHLAGAEICAHLAHHGVTAEASHDKPGPESEAVSPALKTVGGFGFQQRGAWTQSRHPAIGEIDIGDALLSAVSTLGIDLLVMGAYGHSRIRELVLGGATRQVLTSMTVPVVMSS